MTPSIEDDNPIGGFRRAFRERWANGDRVLVEQFRDQTPEIQLDPTIVLDLILLEFVLRAQRGEKPTDTEYFQRFPDLESELRRRFASHFAEEDAQLTLSHHTGRGGLITTPQITYQYLDPKDRPLPTIPGYRFITFIDEGGQGEVWRAEHLSLGREVAIKLLRPDLSEDPTHVERFRREARSIARLDHDHVVQVFDFGEYQGRLFLVMELLEGGSLRSKLNEEPMNPRTAAGLAATLASAIAEAHKVGIVHRDLKPENVLFNNKGRVKITDFGMAKQLGELLLPGTMSGGLLGTIYYMSPEQAAGRNAEIGPPTDVWALGVILYELLTGRRPFEGTRGEVLGKIQFVEATPITDFLPDIPRELAKICYRCLAKQIAHRYADAEEFLEAIRRFLNTESEPVASQSSSTPHKTSRDSIISWRENHTVVEGWGTWIDPLGRCTSSLQEGKLTMLVPGGDFDLGIERRVMNAPRILREVKGNFTLQVLVSCYLSPIHQVVSERLPFQGAGLVIIADSQTYIRLEKAAYNRRRQTVNFINYEVRQNGKCTRYGRENEGVSIPAKKTYLRLKRTGSTIQGFVSSDQFRWRELETLDVPLPETVQIGTVVVNLSSEGFFPIFSNLSVHQASDPK